MGGKCPQCVKWFPNVRSPTFCEVLLDIEICIGTVAHYSVVTETYDGVANQGVTGLFTGLGWGLVGTISKPAIGMLDLATGAATAVRESSRSSSKQGRNSIDRLGMRLL